MANRRKVTPNTLIVGHKQEDSAKVVSLFPQSMAVKEIVMREDEDSDALLLERIADGEHSAFAMLVRRHTDKFYRVAYRFMRARSESEDIVQEAFIKLWEKPTMWQADKNSQFTTWFYRVVVNLCLDHLKKKRPLELVDDTWVVDDRATHEENLLNREKQQLLDMHIKKLPERQRTALNLCFYEELSNQEAADVMGLHLKALQSLLMRAKSTLKEKLGFMSGENL